MKKILLTVFAVLMVITLCFSAVAIKEYSREDMAEDEFIMASIHGTSSFVKSDEAMEPLYTTLEWSLDGLETHNIKSVAFLGALTSGSKITYAQYVTKEGHTYNEFIDACLTDQAWNDEWDRLASTLKMFTNNYVPYSVTMGRSDYPANGGRRTNLYDTYFNSSNLFPDSTMSSFYDGLNYFYIFTEDDVDYIVFNLELWPRQDALKWVDKHMAENSDKRAIVYTQSFLETNGEMIHMFDWDDYVDIDDATFLSKYVYLPEVTTQLKNVNMWGLGKPHDGDGLWEKCLKKHDNLFLIITGQNASASKITTKLLQNDAGYDVLAISANSGEGENVRFLFTGISDKGETVNLNYYSAIKGGIDEDTSKSFTLNLKEVIPSSEKDPVITYLMNIEGQIYGANSAYINGLGENRFGPQENMTRAQAITIIARLMDPEETFKGQYNCHYTDVSESDWFYDYVSFLYCGKLLGRYGDTLEPNKPITRAEFVELLYLTGVFPKTPRIVAFKDVPKSSDFFDAVSAAAANGIVNGYEDATFRPDNNITRAEMVTIVNRVLGISATADLVDVDSLETVFSDIDEHWAYYNILMSANDNVKGKSVASDIDTSRISTNASTITLSTDYADVVINKSKGTVSSVIDKATGKEIGVKSSVSNFVYLKSSLGTFAPTKAEFKDNRLVFTFDDGTYVNIVADVKAEYFTLEVENEIPKKYTSVEFGNIAFNYGLDKEDGIAAITYAMNVNTNPNEYPDAKSMTTRATAFSDFGTSGAKAAFIIAPKNLHRDYMKMAMEEIEDNEGIVSYIAGPYALDYAGNFEDYVIVSDSDPEMVESWIEIYSKYDVDTIDFHKGNDTFRSGDFVFYKTQTTTSFKYLVEKCMAEKGIASDAHPYWYYATPEGSALLGEGWQSGFNYVGTYTLDKQMGLFATSIKVAEDFSTVIADAAKYPGKTLFAIIDNEVINVSIDSKYNLLTFTAAERAQGGTEKGTHAAGAQVVLITANGTGASLFKEIVSDPLEEAGITAGLHTYAFYINPDATELLSDPYWLSQLETMEVFTLESDISATSMRIPTVESTEGRSVNTNFYAHDSIYITIDDELIKMNFGANGFINCTRGVGGTVATSHKAGATIRHIGGCFNLLAPDMDSDLFLEVARRTAQAYNEGGFEMIYLDALDGLGRHSSSSNNDSSNSWYYAAIFVNEILKHCETEPLIEYSTMQPTIWAGRGRMGAWDTASRGFKSWNEAHVADNQTYIDRYYGTTLGWYNFYPTNGGALYDWETSEGYPGNFINKYEFFDDVDHMGSLAVAYNMSIVYNPLSQNAIDFYPGFKRNIENYARYNTLRKANYFSEEVKATIRDTMMNSDIEYALIDKADGSYAFVEKYYINNKLTLIDAGENVISGNNPFEAQKPFIRIQNYLSTDGSEPITVMEFDETKELGSQTMKKSFARLNLIDNLAFKIKVYGNNSDGAIAIRVTSATSADTAYYFYIIPLDFEGWKEFTLAEPDNGDMTIKYGFTMKARNYNYYRARLNYDQVTEVLITKSGNIDGVKVGDLVAVAHKNNPITNPTVTVGNESITFNTTLNSTEYIEYHPDDAVAYVYDFKGNTTQISVTGTTPTVPGGDFKATFTGTDSDNMPMRAEVTFGFTGDELSN